MELIFGIIVFTPLLISINESNGRTRETIIAFPVSGAIGLITAMLISKVIWGWLSLTIGIAIYYFSYYKLDHDFEYFINKKVLKKKQPSMADVMESYENQDTK